MLQLSAWILGSQQRSAEARFSVGAVSTGRPERSREGRNDLRAMGRAPAGARSIGLRLLSCQRPGAVVTEYHKLGGFRQEEVIPP